MVTLLCKLSYTHLRVEVYKHPSPSVTTSLGLIRERLQTCPDLPPIGLAGLVTQTCKFSGERPLAQRLRTVANSPRGPRPVQLAGGRVNMRIGVAFLSDEPGHSVGT